MTDPLEILDELESIRAPRRHETVREICPNRCQALRAAIEAQAAELAQVEQEVENVGGWFNAYQSVDSWLIEQLKGGFVVEHDKPDDNTIASIEKLVAQARNDLERMEDTFQRRVVLHAEALARIARLEECIRTLTYSNYRDGRRFIGFPQNSDVTGVTEVLNETEPQSLAAMKAEVLRECARKLNANNIPDFAMRAIMDKADRIEREAKETQRDSPSGQ